MGAISERRGADVKLRINSSLITAANTDSLRLLKILISYERTAA